MADEEFTQEDFLSFAEVCESRLLGAPHDILAPIMREWEKQGKWRRPGTQSQAAITLWHIKWTALYKEIFGWGANLFGVAMPAESSGFDWIIMPCSGLTLNQALARCETRFSVFSYLGNNLDKEIADNERTATRAYAVRFRNRTEADDELKNISAVSLRSRNIKCITLLERLLLELWFDWDSKDHLDRATATLCGGSRLLNHDVPIVYWDRGKLNIDSVAPSNQIPVLRGRAAIL